MDAFSASLMADKREIVFAPTVYKFQTFAQMAEEFNLGERDVVLTNEFIYTPFMKELGLKCNFVFQEKFGAGEPSEAMIQTMYDAIPYDSYDRVIAVGGGAIMDLCKLLGCKRPDTVHNLYFKRFPVVHEKDVIAIPTTCGTGSECTNISVAIVKDEKDGVLTGGETKLGLVSDDIIPNKVCLIPDLLKTALQALRLLRHRRAGPRHRVLPQPPPQDHDLRAVQREGHGHDPQGLQAHRREGSGRPL